MTDQPQSEDEQYREHLSKTSEQVAKLSADQPLPDEDDQILDEILLEADWTRDGQRSFEETDEIISKAKLALQAYTNRAVLRVLERVGREVIGAPEDLSKFGENNIGYGVAYNKNHLRAKQRQSLSKISKEYLGGNMNKLRFKKGDKVTHDYSKELGEVLETRDDPKGYSYYIKFQTRTDWFKEEVLR